MRQISAPELKAYLDTENRPVLLDVREPWEYETCHIKGSVHIPMGEIPSQHGELNPGHETVVICHHGMRSLQVCQLLEKMGFENVVNLSGGLDAWAREVDLTMPVY